MRRHQLTDEQWDAVESLIPRKQARTGRPPEDPRDMLDGIFWILRTGSPWRDLPERFGPWQTVYDYFSSWRRSGVFDRVLEALQVRLDADGRIDWDLWCIDGASVRARAVCRRRGEKSCRRQHKDEPPDHALGRSRGGFESKFHLVTDGNGTPLGVTMTAGQAHESTQVESVMERIAIPQPIGRPRSRPKRLAGDKAYRGRRVREWLRTRRIGRVIPSAENERARRDGRVKFEKLAYRRRAIIENCVGWLKECRRIVTRFEKLALNYLGMLKLAMIERYLRMI